jgi:hypothetical protein
MASMRRARPALALSALVLAAWGLTGCEFSGGFAAHCSTQPLVPHQDIGTVYGRIDVPLVLHPGEQFTVTVLDVGTTVGSGPLGSFHGGALVVTGPVSPSGALAVGQRFQGVEGFVGTPFPNTLDFEVTGQPGDSVAFSVPTATVFVGDFPNGYFHSCGATGSSEIVRIDIVEPDGA